MLKGFRIGACMQEISMVSKLTLGLKHPVYTMSLLYREFGIPGYHVPCPSEVLPVVAWRPASMQAHGVAEIAFMEGKSNLET